jgi:hypothetical protein
MEDFINTGYFRVQQSLENSQKEIDELLKPVTGSLGLSGRPFGPKENIDAVSRNLRNSLLDLQKMHSQQSMILNFFKDLTGNLASHTKEVVSSDVGCQTNLTMTDLNSKPLSEKSSSKTCNLAEPTTQILESLSNMYKFRLYNIVHNPQIALELTSKTKILEPYVSSKNDEKASLSLISHNSFKVEGFLTDVNKKLTSVKIEATREFKNEMREEEKLRREEQSVGVSQQLPNVNNRYKHQINAQKNGKTFIERLLKKQHQDEVEYVNQSLGVHKRGKSLKFGDFKVKTNSINQNIKNLKVMNNKFLRNSKDSDGLKSTRNFILPKLTHFQSVDIHDENSSNVETSILRSIQDDPKFKPNKAKKVGGRKSDFSQIIENPQISIKISIPGLEDLKPKVLRPFHRIVSEDEFHLRQNYERLSMYPELAELAIDDLVNEY